MATELLTRIYRIQAQTTQAQKQINDYNSSVARAGTNMAELQRTASRPFNTSSIQNASYQVTDFAVQIASGTSATQAFVQQSGQLLAGFGLWGAAVGAAVTIVGLLAKELFGAEEAAQEFDAGLGSLEGQISALESAAESYSAALRAIGDASDASTSRQIANSEKVFRAEKVLLELKLDQLRATQTSALADIAARRDEIARLEERRGLFLSQVPESQRNDPGILRREEAWQRRIDEQVAAQLILLREQEAYWVKRAVEIEEADAATRRSFQDYVDVASGGSSGSSGSSGASGADKPPLIDSNLPPIPPSNPLRTPDFFPYDEEVSGWVQLSDQLAEVYEKNLTPAIRGFTDALFDADRGFEEFTRSILENIAKMMVEFALLRAVQATVGYLASNAPSTSPVPPPRPPAPAADFQLAAGGVVGGGGPVGVITPGAFGTMAENGPEAVMPLRRTASGDLGVRGIAPTVNIYNQTEAEVSVSEGMSNDGGKTLEVFITSQVNKGLATGRFDKTLATSFGVNRRSR